MYLLESIISHEDLELAEFETLAKSLILNDDKISQLEEKIPLSEYFKSDFMRLRQSKESDGTKLKLVKALLYTGSLHLINLLC